MYQEASQNSGSGAEDFSNEEYSEFVDQCSNSGSGVADFFNEEYFEFVDQYLKLHPTDSTGYVTKIESLLVAGRYKEAFLFFEHSSVLHSEMKELLTATYLTSGAQFLDISEDIVGPATGRSSRLLRPDGDFIGPVEIRMTNNGCGRGLFATQNIQRGEVVLISKALAVSHEPDTKRNPLLQIVKDALHSCGQKARQIFLSHCVKDRSRFIPKMSDFVTEYAGGNQSDWAMLCQFFDELTETVKEYQILRVLELIAFDNLSPFAMREKSKEPAIFEHVPARRYYGVWLLPSFVNHSCVPNAARINVGDLIRIHATRTIKSGDEITIPYFNVLVPFPSRHQFCSNFGFTCVCKRCELEAKKMKKSSELKDLYSEYTKISMSDEMGKRASQLQKLLIRVQNCVEYLHDTEILSQEDEMFEKWYRASFTPVYLASLLNRHRNEARVEFCLVNETNFTDIAHALLETCPGSLHCLVFFHEFRGKFREFLALHGNGISPSRKELYEEYVNNAGNCMMEIAPSIYGSPNLQNVIHTILQQPV